MSYTRKTNKKYTRSWTQEERFWKYVEKTDKCWLWKASIAGQGYGQFQVAYKTVYAHRFSYILHKGPIPRDKEVMHSCDVRICVNPDHLTLGTRSDNMRDCVKKGRLNHVRGPKVLTTKQIECIRKEYEPWVVSHRDLAKKYGVSRTTIAKYAK